MTTYYATPAAANYYTPPSHNHRQRGVRVCDTCGTVEQPTIKPFRLCGGCMTTNYCSQDCQRKHWPSHKQICQHTVAQVAATKQQPNSADYPDENIAKLLRRFTSQHTALLGWAGFQALQLKRVPSNVRQSALLIELTPRPSSDPNRQFAIKGTHIVPRTYVTSRDPLVAADIQRREERCRRAGGSARRSVSQVMPVEVDPPAKISWDERNDWADVFAHFVDSGRTDFKPISTTTRGVYYG
ncbi:hypothetical protein BGY98DRAFT_971218 [Russula aff. rugulosa BPL654]|nr:hypothetical protein BGY98DRAFT_971218 [Russula aff. rugulosa BPL654]